jgi:hypothetical protein
MLLERERERETSEKSISNTSNNNQSYNTSQSAQKDKLFNKKKIYTVIQCDNGMLILIFLYF